MRRLCPPPGFRPEAVREISRAPFASRDHGPCGQALRPAAIYRSVREPARPTAIRVAWNRERCVLLFASRASVDLALGASLCVRRQALRRATCTSHNFRCEPRMLIPRARCRPPCWKNLNQEVPTSDVPCRSSGTDHRLQPTHRCPRPSTHLAMPRRPGGFTRRTSVASRFARKG